MSTMPSKNRSIMLGVAALALAVMVGVWALNRGGEPQLTGDPDPVDVAGETDTDTPDDSGTVSTDDKNDTTDVVDDETDVEATPVMGSVPEKHVVQEGETLSSIAKHYYGNSAYAGDIEALNDLPNPDQLEVGQELVLPQTVPALAN